MKASVRRIRWQKKMKKYAEARRNITKTENGIGDKVFLKKVTQQTSANIPPSAF